jgi:hypothetical protein
MMPAEIMTAAVAVLSDSSPQTLDLIDQLFAGYPVQVFVRKSLELSDILFGAPTHGSSVADRGEGTAEAAERRRPCSIGQRLARLAAVPYPLSSGRRTFSKPLPTLFTIPISGHKSADRLHHVR